MKKKRQICATCKSLINSSLSPRRSKCSLGYKMEWIEKDQQYIPGHQCINSLNKLKDEDK